MILHAGNWWLAPIGLAFLAALAAHLTIQNPVQRARMTLAIAASGLCWTALQGLVVVQRGPRLFEELLTGDAISAGQSGLGLGAGICLISLLFALTVSMSQMGKGRGDAFIVSTIGLIIALVGVFVSIQSCTSLCVHSKSKAAIA